METVKFPCEHCGNLMAVTMNLIGQQVRCPHCQQVVVAPASHPATTVVVPNPIASPVAEDLSFSVNKELRDHESIFAEGGGDDLFGGAPTARVELPPEPLASLEMQPTSVLLAAASPASIPAGASPLPTAGPAGAPLEATIFQMASPPIHSQETAEVPAAMVLPGMPPTDGTAGVTSPPDQAAEVVIGNLGDFSAESISSASQVFIRPVAGAPRIFYWLVVFLVPYAIFITAVAITYYFMYRNKPSPLEAVPDVMGDFKEKTRRGPGSQSYQLPAHDSALPDKLRVRLGQPVQLGDLEAVAEKIEQKPVTFLYRGGGLNAEADTRDSLVLHLRLKNISANVFFHPADPYFDRRWIQEKDGLPPPYTFLEAGSKRFYGGAVRRRREPDAPREYIEGQEDNDKELKPGQELRTVVCTAPEDDVPKKLRGYLGNLLWRVQLRRGLLRIGDTDYPVTAVIGVEFSMKDVLR